jgi:diguanylate cyclase (GGDEF)-like protein
MADVDFFKLFNDTYGHQAGDNCLIMIAQVIKGVLNRPADLVARYGGEEFGIIMPNTDLNGGVFIAKKIKQNIIDKQISFKGSSINNVVTVSLGIATFIPSKENDKSMLILSADKSLYQAKKLGRNRIHVFNLDQIII